MNLLLQNYIFKKIPTARSVTSLCTICCIGYDQTNIDDWLSYVTPFLKTVFLLARDRFCENRWQGALSLLLSQLC